MGGVGMDYGRPTAVYGHIRTANYGLTAVWGTAVERMHQRIDGTVTGAVQLRP
jgi:hypothetical protein